MNRIWNRRAALVAVSATTASMALAAVSGRTGQPLIVASCVDSWPDQKRGDVLTSIPMYVKELTAEFDFESESEITESMSELDHMIRSGGVDAALVPFVDLLRYQDRWNFEPVANMVKGGQVNEQLILLAGSRGDQLVDLADAKLLIPPGSQYGEIWMRSLIVSLRETTPGNFFGSIEIEKKELNAVIEVVRGKADCCLVTRLTYDSIRDLSPRMLDRLHVIAKSPEYPRVLLTVRADLDPDDRQKIIDAATVVFAKKARGRQLMTMFRIDGFAVYKPASTAVARQLVLDHLRD